MVLAIKLLLKIRLSSEAGKINPTHLERLQIPHNSENLVSQSEIDLEGVYSAEHNEFLRAMVSACNNIQIYTSLRRNLTRFLEDILVTPLRH